MNPLNATSIKGHNLMSPIFDSEESCRENPFLFSAAKDLQEILPLPQNYKNCHKVGLLLIMDDSNDSDVEQRQNFSNQKVRISHYLKLTLAKYSCRHAYLIPQRSFKTQKRNERRREWPKMKTCRPSKSFTSSSMAIA